MLYYNILYYASCICMYMYIYLVEIVILIDTHPCIAVYVNHMEIGHCMCVVYRNFN